MSWSNFEDLKRFARKNRTAKTKRPAGWQNPAAGKRRRTNNDSLSFVSNSEDGEIEGFSSEDERDNDESLDHKADSKPRNSNHPVIKRKSKKRQPFTEKQSTSSKDNSRSCDDIQSDQHLNSFSCSLPDGALDLLQVSKQTKEDEIVWDRASDEEDFSHGTTDEEDSEDANSEMINRKEPTKTCNVKCPDLESSAKGVALESQHLGRIGEVISDFQSDEERSTCFSQESVSVTISTPTPTPVSPVVVGTPKTASEWLRQVQLRSPQGGGGSVSPEERGAAMMQYDSAKKKKKFMRAGLAEQLQRIVAREKSEKTFWNHHLGDTEREQRSTRAAALNSGCPVVQILSDVLQTSLHFTQCCMLSEDNDCPMDPPHRLVDVLFTCDTWKQSALHVGAVVKIHPPWQKLVIAGSSHPVLLCTYFCEKHAAPPGSPVVDITSVQGHGILIQRPGVSCSSSNLLQSPRKGFKPSKLLFGETEDPQMKPTKSSSLTLTTVQPTRSNDNTSRPNRSILSTIESCGGYGGAVVGFCAVVQRVYSKRMQTSRQNQDNLGCALLSQTLKSNARTVKEIEEVRWTLLVQDIQGMFAEIQVPPKFQESSDWHSCIAKGAGNTFTFTEVRVLHRTNRTRSPGLFNIIHSLWSTSDDKQVPSNDVGSQIVTQESDSEATRVPSPPDFSYVLMVQGSSRVTTCQDSDMCEANLLYKPPKCRPLWEQLHCNTNCNMNAGQCISTCCKLLYCRFSGAAKSPPLTHSPSFELFVTDSSLQSDDESEQESEILSYERIVGHSSHVVSDELRGVLDCPGIVLCLTDLHREVESVEGKRIVADTYSVIRKGVPDSISTPCRSLQEAPVSTEVFDSLACLKPAPLPVLTDQSRLGYIYLIEGCVTGVDEESACCWLVCGTCASPNIIPKQGTRSRFFCPSCKSEVESPQTKTHLEVLVKVKSSPNAHVKVKLLQNTIDKLLPVSYQDSEQEYDVEAVLGKPLGPMNCYVTECALKDDGIRTTTSFSLEEIYMS